MNIGAVIRLRAEDIRNPKIKKFIIVGSTNASFAIIFINSNIQPQNLGQLQGLQLPLSTDTCPFLDHNSYADCSDVRERDKSQLNNILQKEPGRKEGDIPADVLKKIIEIIKKAKTLSAYLKETYFKE